MNYTLFCHMIGRKKSQGRAMCLMVVHFSDSSRGMANLSWWKDGRHIFNTKTSHLRQLLSDELPAYHSSVTKWQNQIQWASEPSKL